MRQIEIYINNTRADFKDLESLPLTWHKATDKFLEIVGSSGTELEQVFRSMSFPATQNNKRIFKANQSQSVNQRGDTVFSMKIYADGLQMFNGQVALKSTTRKQGIVSSYLVEAIGDGSTMWEKIDTLTLNDIDLGVQLWTDTEIFDSWQKTVDDTNGIFAPVVYGATTGEEETFSPNDFRLAVYYIPILRAIFKKVGYQIESRFFQSFLMRDAVYLYGNGAKMKRGAIGNIGAVVKQPNIHYYNTVASFVIDFDTEVSDPQNQFNNNIFTVANLGEFEFALTISPQMNTDIEFVITNGSYTTTAKYTIADNETAVVKHTVTLEVGQTVTIKGYCLDNGAPSVVNFAELKIAATTKPMLGTSIDVASCLHDKPIKDFLRGVTHQFCGAWRVNETIKRVYFEPRFDYVEEINGTKTTYEGFYNNASKPSTYLLADVETIETTFNIPFGEKLTIGYAEDSNDPLEVEYKKSGSVIPYSATIGFNKRGGKESSSRNPYFTNLYQSKPNGIKRASALPTVLPQGYKIGEVLPGTVVTEGTPPESKTIGTPTFESSPKCGLMLRGQGAIKIKKEGAFYTNYPCPLITQQFEPQNSLNYNFSMSYADTTRSLDNQLVKGLISNLFQKYFAIIRQGIQQKLQAKIELVDLAQLTFENLIFAEFDHNPSLWVHLAVEDFKISDDKKAYVRLIKHVEPTVNDVAKTTFFDPQISILTPDLPKK